MGFLEILHDGFRNKEGMKYAYNNLNGR